MRGSWKHGSRIAMSCDWAERRGYPRRSAPSSGRSSNACVLVWPRRSSSPCPACSAGWPRRLPNSKNPPLRLCGRGRGPGHRRRASAVPRRAWAADRANSLFFAGDLGQRIFQQPFSWKALGVDIRGRSRTLHVNYRTSHQIRMQADRLLGPEVSDVDGNTEERSHTISVFNGPAPTIQVVETRPTESCRGQRRGFRT